jgi:amylosucrase
MDQQKLYCVFNFSAKPAYLTWYAFKEHGISSSQLFDHWSKETHHVGPDRDHLVIEPYSFLLLEELTT